MTLSELPFNHLFSFVSVQDRFSCRIVCKDWFSRIPFPELGELTEVIQKTGILTVKIFHLFSIPENHSTLSNVFTFLQTRKILNSANFYSASVKTGFQFLIKVVHQLVLTQDHFKALMESSNLYEVARGIPLLGKAKILNEDNLLLIAESTDAWSLASCYAMLQTAGFLDEEVKKLVSDHPSAQMLNKTFELLQENKCFTKQNVKRVLKYPKIDKLIWMIPAQEYPWKATCQTDEWYAKQIYEVLKKCGILSLENKILTQEHDDHQALYEAFMQLPTQMQTDLNFRRIAIHQDEKHMFKEVKALRQEMRARIYVMLHSGKILSIDNKKLVQEHGNLKALYEAFSILKFRKLSEIDFRIIVSHDDPVRKAKEIAEEKTGSRV